MNTQTSAEIAYVKDFCQHLVEEPLDYPRVKGAAKHEIDSAAYTIMTNKIFLAVVSAMVDKWKDDMIYSEDAKDVSFYRAKILALRDLLTTLRGYASNVKS